MAAGAWSVRYLMKRDERHDRAAHAAVEIVGVANRGTSKLPNPATPISSIQLGEGLSFTNSTQDALVGGSFLVSGTIIGSCPGDLAGLLLEFLGVLLAFLINSSANHLLI